MANRPIDIKFTADVAKALSGIKGVEVSLEDVQQALVEASNDSADLERKLSRAMKDAETDVDGLRKSIDRISDSTDNVADEARKDFDRIGDEASDAGRNAGQNLGQSLGEGLSSGDVGGVLQEVLGESIGEVSGPASAAVAAMAGLALVLWNKFEEESKKKREDIIQQFDLIDEITGQIDRSAQVMAAFTELGGGELTVGLEKAAGYAEQLGIDVGDLGSALTGEVNPATEALVDYLEGVVAGYDAGLDITYEQKAAAEEVLGIVEKEIVALDQAQKDQRTLAQGLEDDIGKSVTNVDTLTRKIEQLPSKKKVEIELTTSGMDTGFVVGYQQSGYQSVANNAKKARTG